mmetsp:Transcript_19213/g.67820  ORF Transcript_19213/g.67820 Transcript_19213/m.67820 type:complete len:1060 (-) Transcript_19213:922-4101(-)
MAIGAGTSTRGDGAKGSALAGGAGAAKPLVQPAPALLEWYGRHVVAAPCRTYAIGLCVVLALVAGCGLAPFLGMSESTAYDWTVTNSVQSERQDAFDAAIKVATDGGGASGSAEQQVAERTEVVDGTTFVYEALAGGDVFTPVTVQQMCEVENIILGHPRYTDFCLLAPGGAGCAPAMLSVVSQFYPISSQMTGGEGDGAVARDCTLLSDADFEAAYDQLMARVEAPATRLQAGFFVAADTLAVGFSTRARSMIFLGGPLKGFTSTEDPAREQRALYRGEFWTDVEQQLFAYFSMEGVPLLESPYRDAANTADLNVRYINGAFGSFTMNRIVNGDLAWTVGAIVFVLLYIGIHTGSALIAVASILQIVLSLPCAFFLYGTIFRIPYVSQIQVLVMYLVLGIGADDVFVLVDGYKQLHHAHAHTNARNEVDAIVQAIDRTRAAVFNTSFTTAVAFFATALSPILPVSVFGIFAAAAVAWNYVFVLTLTPPVLVWWDRHLRGKGVGEVMQLLRRKEAADGAESPDSEAPAVVAAGDDSASVSDATEAVRGDSPAAVEPISEKDVEDALRPIERFLSRRYAVALNKQGKAGVKWLSLGIVVVYVAGVVAASYSTAQLSTPTEQEQWFPSSHMFTGMSDLLLDGFLGAEDRNYVDISIVWGISGIDRDGHDRFLPGENRGRTVFDDAFDLSDRATQESVMATCDLIRNRPCSAVGCTGGGLGRLALTADDVDCVLEDMRAWHRSQVGDESADLPTGAAFTEAAIAYGAARPASLEKLGVVDGKVRFAAVEFKSTLLGRQPFGTTNSVYEECEALVGEVQASAPAAAGSSIFHVAGRAWVWMRTEEGLVDGLFQGIAIAFPCAFLVLVMATRNWIIATYAILSVASVVVCVLGFVQSVGWALGIAESIAGVIVIGLAVDFSLHLSHFYVEAPVADRQGRVRYALRSVGFTVIAGAATTLGAGAMLFIGQLTFFTRMAVLLTSTITFSFLSSMGFFCALCALVGPEGDAGDVRVLGRNVSGVLCAGRRTHVTARHSGAAADGVGTDLEMVQTVKSPIGAPAAAEA